MTAANRFQTATDVIDYLSEQATELIVRVNTKPMSAAQFEATHARTFAALLPAFLDRMEQADPQAAQRLRRQFVTEMENAA